MRLHTLAALFTLAALTPITSLAESVQTSAGPAQLNAVVSGLEEPWGFGFLPDRGLLITERGGRLLHVRSDGTSGAVEGLPDIKVGGQGGLLDVMIPADFAQSREVFLSFSIQQRRGAGTGLAVGRLSRDGTRLEETRVIFASEAGSRGGRHFGSRIVEGRDGKLYLTIGDRGDEDSAQDLRNQNGTVVRLNRDGSVPSDNPFVGQASAQPEIWSYGHRNPQGATLDLNGNLWVVEHGARGGDEVNRVQKGANYGWPVIAFGKHYSGRKIGEGTEKAGMEQPEHYWDPSIAPSGMMVYSGALWPEWRGDVFVGSLKFGYLSRLDGTTFAEEEIEADATARTRDVREGPDGAIWFLSVGNGALYRMTPGDGA
ncbi:MAG: PQQ-dependent sugar dehydrogenase [Dinoroseobacter sp.]|nr:PQQ-dependent sugar dehydrogenase [Dinoroseobacter sp.]MDJ0993982.1 PQQ-dependent sugar dehydrogenase [Dinoroseobacter sp.]